MLLQKAVPLALNVSGVVCGIRSQFVAASLSQYLSLLIIVFAVSTSSVVNREIIFIGRELSRHKLKS